MTATPMASVEKLNGHTPAGPFRGGKYSIYEGGTRMPFLVAWPGKVKPGVSDALVCQVDFLASFAALLGKDLSAEAGADSVNVLPALLGEAKAGREHVVEQSGQLAIRKGPWKFIPGGSAKVGEGKPGAKRGGAAEQLYNLADDPGETRNVAGRQVDIVKELAALLQQVREQGKK